MMTGSGNIAFIDHIHHPLLTAVQGAAVLQVAAHLSLFMFPQLNVKLEISIDIAEHLHPGSSTMRFMVSSKVFLFMGIHHESIQEEAGQEYSF